MDDSLEQRETRGQMYHSDSANHSRRKDTPASPKAMLRSPDGRGQGRLIRTFSTPVLFILHRLSSQHSRPATS